MPEAVQPTRSPAPAATVHASAVLVGPRAVLIRGPAASGKSSLALGLLNASKQGLVRFSRLVTDDRAELEPYHGRLVVRPPAAIEGMIEIRGLGIHRVPFEPMAVIGLVVDLAASDAERLPPLETRHVEIEGIRVARLAVRAGAAPLSLVLQAVALAGSDPAENLSPIALQT